MGVYPPEITMLRRILATVLFCDAKDLPYVLLHIPVGVANAGIPIALYLIFGLAGAILGGCLSLIFGGGFIMYELTEWWVIKDVLYPDLQGWLWGIMGCVVLTVIVYLTL